MPFLSFLHGVGIHTTNSPRRRSESGENCTGINYGRHSKPQRVFRRAILWSLGVSSKCVNCYDKQEEEAKTAGHLIGASFRLIVSSALSYAARKNRLTLVSRPHIHWIRISGMEEGRSRIGSIQRFIWTSPNRFETREMSQWPHFTLRSESAPHPNPPPFCTIEPFSNRTAIDKLHFIKRQSQMLLVDKQRPKSLSEMDYHKNISQNLIKMVMAENPALSE